ncbi:MAG: hypothetical protein R3B48_24230 [Kofleriaceae bacterium]
MSSLDEILDGAAGALGAANSEDAAERLLHMNHFMLAFERLSQLNLDRLDALPAVRTWATKNARPLMAARRALEDWSLESGRLFYGGGEEEAERALERRSRFQVVCEVFRATDAGEWLQAFASDDVDQDYREQAAQCALDPPDWVPRSHTWWYWREGRQ